MRESIPPAHRRDSKVPSLIRSRSIVVDHLCQQKMLHPDGSSIAVALLYIKYNDPEHSLNNLLASLLKQLAQDQESLPSVLKKLYERYGELGTPPSSADIIEALACCFDLYKDVYFVIDALDECTEDTRWQLVEKLRELDPKVCILILSRFRGDIEEELHDFERVEIKASKADIELFIDGQIQKNPNLRRIVGKSPSLRGDIKVEVVRTAKEM